jgi:hypothetical protein
MLLAVAVLRCGPKVTDVALCDLLKDPARYNHKLIQVTGFVSHGFEDFTLFDPRCPSEEASIWLEYGGTFASGTMYCCGVGRERSRTEPLVVEQMKIPVLRDAKLLDFDRLVQQEPDSIVHATLRGHFFSGERQKFPGGTAWVGYGHFGMHCLLAIEQVKSVDPQDLLGVDVRSSGPHPPISGVGCFSRHLGGVGYKEAIAEQAQAENGATWRFEDPKEVALERFVRLLGKSGAPVLKETQRSTGMVVFDGAMTGSTNRFMAVVSRPYWLSFYAKDRNNIAWTVKAAYEYGCPTNADPQNKPPNSR